MVMLLLVTSVTKIMENSSKHELEHIKNLKQWICQRLGLWERFTFPFLMDITSVLLLVDTSQVGQVQQWLGPSWELNPWFLDVQSLSSTNCANGAINTFFRRVKTYWYSRQIFVWIKKFAGYFLCWSCSIRRLPNVIQLLHIHAAGAFPM